MRTDPVYAWLVVARAVGGAARGRAAGERAAPQRSRRLAPAAPVRHLASVLVALVLVVAGCGGERDAGAPASRATDGPTARRALVVGDSVAFDAAPAVAAALGAARYDVRVEPRLGLGLLRTDLVDWRADWPVFVTESRPSVVVVLVGAWDLPGGVPGAPPQAPDWEGAYRRAAADAVDVLQAGGARVAWIGLPLLRDVAPDRVARLNTLLRDVVDGRPGVVWVDGAAVLAGSEGRFAARGMDDGRELVLRKRDGVHLCPSGAERLAAATLEALGLTAGGWEAGAWRRDARFATADGCPPGGR